VRHYDTGATRDTDAGKLDYHGFVSFTALERFAQYMHQHRKQADGHLRDSDNWKKGIPREDYVKSLTRHVVDFVLADERGDFDQAEELACAIWFNTQGYLHECLRVNSSKTNQ